MTSLHGNRVFAATTYAEKPATAKLLFSICNYISVNGKKIPLQFSHFIILFLNSWKKIVSEKIGNQ